MRIWGGPVLTFLLVLGLAAAGVTGRADLMCYDACARLGLAVRNAGAGAVPVVVAIDGPALQVYGRWPWPRGLFAVLLRRILAGHPSAVGIDLLLSEASAGDDELARVMRGRTVVLAKRLDLRRGGKGRLVVGRPEYPRHELLAAARACGFIDFFPDRDGVARRMLLGFSHGGVEESAFAPALAKAAGARIHPCEKEFWLTIGLGPGACRTVSAGEILSGRAPASIWRGRPVLLGLTALGIGADSYLVAVRALGKIPGVYLHAMAYGTLTAWGGVRSVPAWIAFLSVLAGALFPFCLRRVERFWLLAGWTAGFAAVLGAVSLLLYLGGWWWGPSAAVCASSLGGAFQFVERAAAGHRREQRLRSAFAKFVSGEVLGRILAGPEPVLGGEIREITVIFADLRGFTARAENSSPELVAADLNRHLSLMSQAVLEAGGMVDKFLGDGIMGIFGAPLPDTDHRRRALAAAEALRLALNKPGFLAPGIGVASGPALVGNIGTNDRLEYTAIGDPVNLAARLEEMAGPNEILAAAGTIADPNPVPGWRYLGELRVRGRESPVAVYRSVMPITERTAPGVLK